MKETFIMTKDEVIELNKKFSLDALNIPLEDKKYKIRDKILYGIIKTLKVTKLEKDFEVEIELYSKWK